MGLIKAAIGAAGGTLADQWLDAIGVPDQLMKQDTLLIKGGPLRADARSSNIKGTSDVVSNGSRVVVPTNMTMLLVDGGSVVDATAEPGYYTVDDSQQPSVFAGQWGDSFREAWERFKFGGITPQQQRVLFVNQREIRGIKFGSRQPIQYFDNFYNSELFLRTFGSFTILINDPFLFFANVYDKSSPRVNFSDIEDQFLSEFMSKLTTAIAQLSGQGVRISAVQQHQDLLSQAMAQLLDADWTRVRGIEILQVAVESINYNEKSQELINLRNRGAMLSDPAIQRGYVASTVADALHAAGSNPSGGAAGMLGIGVAGGAAGGLFGGPLVPPAAPQPLAPVPPAPAGPGPAGPVPAGPAPAPAAAGPAPAPAAAAGFYSGQAQPADPQAWAAPAAPPAGFPPAAPSGPAPGAAPTPALAPGAPGAPGAPAAPSGPAAGAAPTPALAPGAPGAPGAPTPGTAPAAPQAGQPQTGPRFCPDCGTPTTGTKFCGNCGRQLW